MKSMKTLVRVVAVIMLAVFAAGLVACNSYNTNPTIATVGSVKIDLKRFNSMYYNSDTSSNPYYSYMANGYITREQYANYIIEDLVNYGVQMDKVKSEGITLDEAEEAKLMEDVDNNIKDYAVSTYSSKIDSSIKGTEEKAAACMEMLKQELADNNAKFEDYRKSIEDSLRNNALIEKLRKEAIGNVEVSTDDMKKYFEDNAKTTTVSAFKSAFDGFVQNSSKAIPLAIPHPENAVEDDPETEADETKEANPYGEMFSVQHLLFKFTEAPGEEDKKDLAAFGAKDADLVAKMNEIETLIPTLDSTLFLAECHNNNLCEDPGMQSPAYQFFGYLMQEDLISSYYDGFGYAAMKLKFGENWEPKAEETTSEETSKEEETTYDVQYFDLTDGARVAKVFTNTGVHYIIINPNDCFCMYDADGYLMLPIYENDNLVTDSEGIVTAKGHMTQEQFDAVNEAIANITKKAETDTDSDADAEKTDETEEPEVLDLKAIFEYYFNAKKEAKESETYAAKFAEWKDSINIDVNKTLLQPYLSNG